MDVYTRISLLPAPGVSADQSVLLEGSWPNSALQRWSLDDTMHAAAGWIDDEAIRLAALCGTADFEGEDEIASPASNQARPLSLAYIQERKLRYYLTKLLRVVAFFDRPPAGLKMADASAGVRLHYTPGSDDDYAELFTLLAARYRWRLELIRCVSNQTMLPTLAASPVPRPSWWRRWAGTWQSRQLERSTPGGPRVVLCGNAAGLDPVCEQLLARHAQVSWLYDKFCVRTWRRWRQQGVHQILCSAAGQSAANGQPVLTTEIERSLNFDGLNLISLVHRWQQRMSMESAGICEVRVQQIRRQFARLRPQVLLVDEDQTPLPRIAVQVAREQGISSVVLQHGVPRVAFGFAPLAADWFFAWGETSRENLKQFGVPKRRIVVTGSARHDHLANVPRWTPNQIAHNPPEILLFTTMPPNDARPDSLRFHLTLAEHDRMLRMTFAAVARSGARLTIKTHPRAARRTSGLMKLLAEFPDLKVQLVRSGDLESLVRRAACGISFLSGAGIDAASLGLPVIDLLPTNAEDLLPAQHWGTLGTARTGAELEKLLATALRQSDPCDPIPQVFAHHGYAAGIAADAVLAVAGGQQPIINDLGLVTAVAQRAHRKQIEPRPPHAVYASRQATFPAGVNSTSATFPSQRVSSR